MAWGDAIHAFAAATEACDWVKRDAVGNLTYKARVRVRASSGADFSQVTKVQVIRNSAEDGTILLTDRGKLKTSTFHNRFSAGGGATCEYNRVGMSFVIRGTSGTYGDYVVFIRPE
ncbi:MAG TPA: hypothetical protein VIL30_21375 [Ramlibacter sp.]